MKLSNQPAAELAPGARVIVALGDNGDLPATVIENIDATCHPLTGMWLVKVDGWNRPFGISAKALRPEAA